MHTLARFGYGGAITMKYRVEFINVAGRIFYVFFISACATIVLPFQCITHPSRQVTTKKYREVLCWDSSYHDVMVWSSVTVLLVQCYNVLARCLTIFLNCVDAWLYDCMIGRHVRHL